MLVLGWHERVALPELGIESAFAKLDTGADRSCLHARDIVLIDNAENETSQLVEFSAPLLRAQHSCAEWPGGGVRRVRARLVEERAVRSSNGGEEFRFVIMTRLVLGTLDFLAEFSLTSREGMRFPVLLGRQALGGRVLVDSSSAHLLADPSRC